MFKVSVVLSRGVDEIRNVVKDRGCCVVQAEDGIRDLVRSRGLGDVYKRQDVVQRIKQHLGLA